MLKLLVEKTEIMKYPERIKEAMATPVEIVKNWDSIARDDVVFRWGSRKESSRHNCRVLNKARHIKLSAHKLNARKAILEAGLAAPCLLTPRLNKIPKYTLARPIHHTKGQDAHKLTKEQLDEFLGENDVAKWYFQEFLPKQNEYRAFVGHGCVLCIFEKVPKTEEMRQRPAWGGNDAEMQWKYIRWSDKIAKPLAKLAIQAIETLDLDFGAIDLIRAKNKLYILEVNTAPAISKYMAKVVAEYFDWLNRENYPKEHLKVDWDKKYNFIFRRNVND